MKKRLMIVVGWLLLAGSVQANDLAPVALQSVTPDRSWFYNLEEVVFDADESYVPNGYIAWTKWYIEGVEQTQGSYYHNMSVCFALYGSPEGDCYELDQGQTTVQIKLMVQSNYGYWDEQTITYTIKEHKGRKYFVKDHLGSVRTTVNRDGNVLGYDDYYPFGLAMPGRSENQANPNDDYKFTGYELDNEAGLDLYHAGNRMYDPVLGRFMQIDRYYNKYPSLSTYQYAANNPVNFIDINGDSIIVLLQNDAAKTAGHQAVLIQDKDNVWHYYSKDGTDEGIGVKGKANFVNDETGGNTFTSLEEFAQSGHNLNEDGNQRYHVADMIPTDPSESQEAIDVANTAVSSDYCLGSGDCSNAVGDVLRTAGLANGESESIIRMTGNGVMRMDQKVLVPKKKQRLIRQRNNAINVSDKLKRDN